MMNATKMKAVVITRYGKPENLQLQEVNIPKYKDNEILVKVVASPITKADTMLRKAEPAAVRLFLGFSKPKKDIIGTCFAGKVVAVGSQVTRFKVGDDVFGESGLDFGSNAEYVAVSEDLPVVHKPDFISFEEAATLCDGPLTSFNFLMNLGEIKSGQRVLINGASGSLGTAAVQIAKYYGAEVTAVCSEKNFELVKQLGADHTIDYQTTDFTQNGQTYHVIYDTIGKLSFHKCKRSLTNKGRYLSPVLKINVLLPMIWTSWFGGKKALFAATGLEKPDLLRTYLEKVLNIIKDGHFQVIMDRTYSFTEVVEGHHYVDSGRKRGNIVLVDRLY